MLDNKRTSTKLIFHRLRDNYPLALVKHVFPCPIDDCPAIIKGNIIALLAHLTKHGLTLLEIVSLARQAVLPRLNLLIKKRQQTKNRLATSKADYLKRKNCEKD